MDKLREQLQQVIWDNEKIIEDRVFALATGGLGVSLTVFQLQDEWTDVALWFIGFSWAVLLMSILLIMISLRHARNKAEQATQMTYTVNSENYHILYNKITDGNRMTKRLNNWSYILTGTGILLTTVAAFLTLILK
jgi:hypothetical protein